MPTTDSLRICKIENVIQESSNIRSLIFKDAESLRSEPGQFEMIWLPGVGEFAMSVSLPRAGERTSVTVKAMGEGSRRLYECGVGNAIGVRGPYGDFFDLSRTSAKGKLLLVGGGTGMVPILVLANKVSKGNRDTRRRPPAAMIIGAKTKAELPFVAVSRRLLGNGNVFPTTDDGSYGFRGLAHQKLQELIDSGERIGAIFSCGPERMMRAVYEAARREGIPAQFSLERIMKCGIGICGSCTLGAYVLCKDGPVLTSEQLSRAENEFGVSHRDKTGKLVAN